MGAQITGGTLAGNGASFVVHEDTNGLADVALAPSGSVVLGAPSRLALSGTIQNDGVLKLAHDAGNGWAMLEAVSDATITGSGEVVFDGLHYNVLRSVGATLTIGPDQVVHGSGTAAYPARISPGGDTGVIVNQGTIRADGAHDRLEIAAGTPSGGAGTLRNEGLIVADTKPLHFVQEAPLDFVNEGRLEAAHSQTIDSDVDISISDTGVVVLNEGASLFLAGSLINASRDNVGFRIRDVMVVLDGNTPSSSPQLFETAGEDRGPYIGGMAQNFAVGTLHIPGAGHVQLVDDFDNSEPSDDCEVLYVDTLHIDPSAKLILGSCNVYYRIAEFDEATNLDTSAGGEAIQIAIAGDTNRDGHVDLVDHAFFSDCLTGPNGTDDSCSAADSDGDGDTDLSDFAALQVNFDGGL